MWRGASRVADWPAALRGQLLDGGLAGGHIYWGLRPQGAPLPALVLTAVGGTIGRTVEGDADLRRSTIQVDAWAATHRDAWLLIEAVLAAVAAPFARDGIRFASAGQDAPRTSSEEAADKTTLFRASADLNFWHD